MESYDLTPRNSIGKQLVEIVGLDGLGVIAHVGGAERVSIGELPINLDRKIVFVCDLLAGKGKNPGITIAQQSAVRQRVKRADEWQNALIDMRRRVRIDSGTGTASWNLSCNATIRWKLLRSLRNRA